MAATKHKKTPRRKQSVSQTKARAKQTSAAQKRGGGLRSWWRGIQSDLQENRYGELISFVLGLILLAFSLYLFTAMGSYLFVGARDQSIVEQLTPWQAITKTLPEDVDVTVADVQNVARVHGAYLSHRLMDRFLGFGSWFLVGFCIFVSVRLMRITKSGHPIKALVYSILLSFWTALFASVIQNLLGMPTFFRWGGVYGQIWLDTLLTTVGWIGVGLILLVSITIIGVLIRYEYMCRIRHALGFRWIKKSKKSSETEQPVPSGSEAPSDPEEQSDKPEEEPAPVCAAPAPRSRERETATEHVEHPASSSSEDIPVTIATGDADSQSNSKAVLSSPPRTMSGYKMPSPDLLADIDESAEEVDQNEINEINGLIVEKLRNFRIGVDPVGATIGPTVTLYEFKLDPGVKITRIRSLEDDIALSVESIGGIRIIAPMPGKGTIGIEVPNRNPRIVGMKALITSQKFAATKQKLPIAIGRTITNDVHLFDLTKMPHLLIAGATGQGKSVGLNVLITSLLYSMQPEELKLILIDPKMLEFSIYESIGKHYLTKLEAEDKYIVTDTAKALPVLESLCVDMDQRYELLTRAKVRNIEEYNKLFRRGHLSPDEGFSFLPYLVLIVDEFADLIMTTGRAIEKPIARLAQKARAAGIHLVLATQRPSTDVITGIIKANFPARMAFKVSSQVDSRTILDTTSAKHLVGRGDMLLNDGKEMLRIQCAFIDTPETERIIEHIASQPYPATRYLLPEPPADEGTGGGMAGSGERSERDPLFAEVARHVVQMQQGSTSNIQRRFNIGYNRAGRIMDQLQECGIVSAQDGSKPRQVLVSDETALEQLINDDL